MKIAYIIIDKMKKFAFIFFLIVLFVGCTTIDKHYTGKRIRVEPESSYYYEPICFYTPNYGMGFGWWNPFLYYSLYNYYWYYPYYYGGYYYYDYRQGRTVITKRQLQKGTKTTSPHSRVRKSPAKVSNRGRINSGSTRSRSSSSHTRTSSKIRKNK